MVDRHLSMDKKRPYNLSAYGVSNKADQAMTTLANLPWNPYKYKHI